MPFKLFHYLIKHCLTGLLLSSITVLGFAYFLMIPGSEGGFFAKLREATEQLMLISHLIMPLVILIGLAYGLGLLHNYSEMVQILQQERSYRSVFFIITVFCLLTVALELFYWPTIQAIEPVSPSQWKQLDKYTYYNNETTVSVNSGTIQGVEYKDLTFGQPIADFNHTTSQDSIKQKGTLLQLYKERNVISMAYAFWKQIYQALWPVPVFFFLWIKLKHCSRGISAANVTASVAMTAISSGLLAEAAHIILIKALIPPILTMAIPLLFCFIFSGYRIYRS